MDFKSVQLTMVCPVKGIDTGLLDAANDQLFVMGANVWSGEEEWPLARAIGPSLLPYEKAAG